MTQVNDELALREALATMTAGQPDAPPDRFTAVRRRAILHRRRQLAGIAAAVAVLAAAAVTIPLSLHASPAPPTTPRHYHVSEQPPGPGAKHDLVATARIDGVPYQLLVGRMLGLKGVYLSAGALGNAGVLGDAGSSNAPSPASRSGDPVSFTTAVGKTPQAALGTVRSDVAYVTVAYGNGQMLTLHPVDVLGPKYAPFVVLVTPYPAAVVRVTAYSRTGELGYAVPFTAAGSVQTPLWLRPDQPARPRPLTRLIGSGSVDGTSWNSKIATGPWGACLYDSSGTEIGSWCWPGDFVGRPRSPVASPVGGTMIAAHDVYIYPGQASSAVAYIEITTRDGKAARVPVVAIGRQRYYAYADRPGNRVVRWAAYSASGLRLAAGSGEVP